MNFVDESPDLQIRLPVVARPTIALRSRSQPREGADKAERERSRLERKIGRLAVEVDWL